METEEILSEMLFSAYNKSKELVATVPELKKKIAELEACKAALVQENKHISVDNKSKEEQIVLMMKELADARVQTAVVQRENQKLAVTVPELKKKITEQEKHGEAWKTELGEKNKQLLNLKVKHLERQKEWQETEEQNVKLLEKSNMMVEHLKEELMLQKQITAGKKKKVEKLVIVQEENNSNVKEEMIRNEDHTQEAFEKQNTRQDEEEEDSSASTEAFELDSHESASKGKEERSPSYYVPRTTKSNNADGNYDSSGDVDDLLEGMSDDEDRPSLGSLLSDRLQSMISTNNQPSSSLEKPTSCKRRKLNTADEKSEGSQVDVEAATDATGLKEEGEDLQSQETAEVQQTSEYTSVNEEPQLRRSSRKRSKTRRWSGTSDDDDSKEENAPLGLKQRFETRVGDEKPRIVHLRKCNLGDDCVACNAPECGQCKFCLDKPFWGGENKLRQCCEDRKCRRRGNSASEEGISSD